MIQLPSRKVVQNAASLKVTLPHTWATNLQVNAGDTLTATWDETTGALLLQKGTTR